MCKHINPPGKIERRHDFLVEQACAVLAVQKGLTKHLLPGESAVVVVLYIASEECGGLKISGSIDEVADLTVPESSQLTGVAAEVYKLLEGAGNKPFIEFQPLPAQGWSGLQAAAICITLTRSVSLAP